MFGDSLLELKRKLRDNLVASKRLADRAEAEKRDFTPQERDTVNGLLDDAAALKGKIAEAEGDAALRKQIEELEAGLGGTYRGDGSPGPKAGAWGAAFTKAMGAYRPMGAKDLISPSGSVAVPSMSRTIAPLGERVQTILQLIPRENLGGTDGYSFLRETVRAHNAAPVAAGGTKPTSVYTVERIDDRVRTIAHLSEPIPRQYLSDITLLRQYVDGALREGLQLALEEQIIAGDGLEENLAGMLETEGIQSQAWDTDPLTTARKAITLLEVVPITPGAFVLHPSDWEAFELLQTEDGAFRLVDGGERRVPVDRARRRLWGLPVALSTGMPEGTGLLVDFAGSTKYWEREGARIDWSENVVDAEGVSDFVKNLIRFRAEGRWGFAVLRPAGVVELDLAAGS